MLRRLKACGAAIALALAGSGGAAAQAVDPLRDGFPTVRVYGGLCVSELSGDIVGRMIMLVTMAGFDGVTWHVLGYEGIGPEGAPWLVRAEVDGEIIRFTDRYGAVFEGAFNENELVGRFRSATNDISYPSDLKRVRRAPDHMPDCGYSIEENSGPRDDAE